VGIAGQIFQHASWRREGAFRIHDPIVTDGVIQTLPEGGRIAERLELPVKAKLPGGESLLQQVDEGRSCRGASSHARTNTLAANCLLQWLGLRRLEIGNCTVIE
jgi:hypothetical protein